MNFFLKIKVGGLLIVNFTAMQGLNCFGKWTMTLLGFSFTKSGTPIYFVVVQVTNLFKVNSDVIRSLETYSAKNCIC